VHKRNVMTPTSSVGKWCNSIGLVSTSRRGMAKQSVVLLGNKFGPEHPDVVRSPANLATLNYGQGRYADAETALQARANPRR
jgi:hypothetical protein